MKYTRDYFLNLPCSELKTALEEFHDYLVQYFKENPNLESAIEMMVKRLNQVGHPMYDLDTGGKEVWGSEYYDRWPDGLEIVFENPHDIRVFWISSGKRKPKDT